MDHPPISNAAANSPSTKHSAAESSLQSFFELFARHERTEQELLRSLVSVCTIEPHATWQALSLMDQYHRRSVLSTTFYRELKKELNAIAFGNAGTHVSVDGKTFAHALTGRTHNFGSTEHATASFATANLRTSGLNTAHFGAPGGPATRMKTVMLDLDFSEDVDKTAARGAAEALNANATQRRPDNGLDTAMSTDDATAWLLTPAQRQQKPIDAKTTAPAKIPAKAEAAREPTQVDRTRTEAIHAEAITAEHLVAEPIAIEPEQFATTQQDATLPPRHITSMAAMAKSAAPSNVVPIQATPATIATPAKLPAGDAAQDRVDSPRVGAVLNDRYVLIEPITSGNISMVFKAFDQQRGALPELERYVAIKCPHANLQNDSRTTAAFRYEYQQSQTILHPNIAKIYDIHEANQQCFIVMELLQGEPLDRLLERIAPRRLPVPRALAIIREIGLALAHAHDHGVVHGNLQASNVTLTRNGEIRVSDFSQAAGWLPPDAPKPQPTDDLYSLACIAHELLCGGVPEAVTPEQRPRYAKHLSTQQWRALKNGLAENRSHSSGRGKQNHIKRWLAELDLRTAEIRLPALTVLESELAGTGSMNIRSMNFGSMNVRTPMVAGAVVGVVIVLAAIVVLVRGMFATQPVTAGQANPLSGIAQNTDPIAAAWAAASTVTPAATNDSSTSAAATPTNNSTGNNTTAVDASQLPTVSFTAERYEVNEQEGVVRLLVQRSDPTNKKLTLRWFTIPGSAQPGIDYVGFQYASVVLQAGQKSAEISIPLIPTSKHERDVSFDVRISATGEALPGRAVVTKVVVLPAM